MTKSSEVGGGGSHCTSSLHIKFKWTTKSWNNFKAQGAWFQYLYSKYLYTLAHLRYAFGFGTRYRFQVIASFPHPVRKTDLCFPSISRYISWGLTNCIQESWQSCRKVPPAQTRCHSTYYFLLQTNLYAAIRSSLWAPFWTTWLLYQCTGGVARIRK